MIDAITETYAKLAKAEARRKKRRAFAGKLVTSLLTNALVSFERGWVLMLAVGVIHAEWIPQLPTIGYWWAVLVVYLLNGILTPITPAKSEGK